MAVRNFYVRGDIDGRQTYLQGGPARKDGGMSLYFTQRDKGDIVRAFSIQSYSLSNGTLKTVVFDGNSRPVAEFVTNR